MVRKLIKTKIYRICAFSVLSFFIVLNLAGCCDDTEDTGETADNGQGPSPTIFPIDICAQSAAAFASATTPEQQAACSGGPTSIMAKHAPLYSPVPHPSVITAQATNTIVGIEKITIYAIKGTMTDCTELGVSPSLIPCRKDAIVLPDQECLFENSFEPVECVLTIDLADGDMISYFAVATPASGPDLASSMITYSGGQPAVEVAVPVWWHTDMQNASFDAARINLAIFIDKHFDGSLSEYGDNLATIVDRSFFTESKIFAEKFTRNRHFFDIWAFPFASASTHAIADLSTCEHKFFGGAGLLDGQVNGSAVLHTKGPATGLSDCSSIGTGGAGSVDVINAKSDWKLVHESGHFLFGLADEYGAGGHFTASEPPNVFSSLGDCETAAPLVGATKTDCKKFGMAVETYRIQTDEPETMKTQLYTTDFRNSSDAAFSNRISKCADGKCYETQ